MILSKSNTAFFLFTTFMISAHGNDDFELGELHDIMVPLSSLHSIVSALEVLPEGLVLVGEQSGKISVVQSDTGEVSTYFELQNVATYTEKGLLDIKLSPTFSIDQHVYLLFTPACGDTLAYVDPVHQQSCEYWSTDNMGCTESDWDTNGNGKQPWQHAIAFNCPYSCGRCSRDGDLGMSIVRYTQVGEGIESTLDPESLYVVWQDPKGYTDDADIHHGGQIAFGPDGCIYAALGDMAKPNSVPKLHKQNGKVIRVFPNGSFPLDNLGVTYDGVGGRTHDGIYAMGFRNPYRISWDLPSGRLLLANVGSNNNAYSQEDLLSVKLGDDFGWPSCDGGPCTSDGPCSCEKRSGYVWGYPHDYSDACIIGGFVYRGNMLPSIFQGSYIYGDYARNFIGAVWIDGERDQQGKLRTVNLVEREGLRPTAFAAAPDGSIYYISRWNPHRFGGSTLWRITYGDSSSTGESTTIDSAPIISDRATVATATSTPYWCPTVLHPERGASFDAGDTVELVAQAQLLRTPVEWHVELAHRDHFHPVVRLLGNNVSFQVPKSGHGFPVGSFLVVYLVDVSTGRLCETLNLFPNRAFIALSTKWPVDLSIDSYPYEIPLLFTTVVGFEHNIRAPQTLCINHHGLKSFARFSRWTDGVIDRKRIFTVPSNMTTSNLTAQYVGIHSPDCHGLLVPSDPAICLNTSWIPSANVDRLCGRVPLNPDGTCLGEKSWTSAAHTCIQLGGRLCSANEIRQSIRFKSKCENDSNYVWTSDSCGESAGQKYIVPSSYSSISPDICVHSDAVASGKVSQLAGVRCCAEGLLPTTVTQLSTLTPTTLTSGVRSERVCEQQGWRSRSSMGTTCATSPKGDHGCYRTTSWDEAKSVCLSIGGRLCTATEILDDVARGTGCKLDRDYVWTQDICMLGPGYGHIAAPGSSKDISMAKQCTFNESNIGVRCCADADAVVPKRSTSSASPNINITVQLSSTYQSTKYGSLHSTTTPADTSKLPVELGSTPCDQLDWNKKKGVCAGSYVLGACYTSVGYEEAETICKSVNSRLCTITELSSKVARGTGCGLNQALVWTTDPCTIDGVSGHIQAAGSGKSPTPRCRKLEDTAGVRCCFNYS